MAAVVHQIDAEMAARAQAVGEQAKDDWQALLAEGVAYIEMALDPDVQRIVLLDGPAVLGDPSQWPSQNACLQVTRQAVEHLIAKGVMKPVDAEAAARLLAGAALNAALWIAASDDPEHVLPKAIDAFRALATGFLSKPA
nr:TetR/AcrR family transcriptional regulator [Rhizobium sp. CG5]